MSPTGASVDQMKQVLTDYALVVVNPHLVDKVQAHKSRYLSAVRRLFLDLSITAADRDRADAQSVSELDLEDYIGPVLDRLADRRFGIECMLRFSVT